MNTCVPSSRCSVMPLRKKSIPSVVMNDGTRKKVVIDAVREPDERREHRARRSAEPDRERSAPRRRRRRRSPARARRRGPTARSISPQIRSITSPAAISAIGRHRLGDVLEVVARVERRASEREVDAEADRDDEDARLAAAQERTGDAPAEAGASFGCGYLWLGDAQVLLTRRPGTCACSSSRGTGSSWSGTA